MKLVLGPITAAQVCDEFKVLELDLIAVKGKTEPVSIYTVVKALSDSALGMHKSFLDAYRRGQWNTARRLAKELNAVFGDELKDYYDMMLERMKGSPPQNWDGVYRATSK